MLRQPYSKQLSLQAHWLASPGTGGQCRLSVPRASPRFSLRRRRVVFPQQRNVGLRLVIEPDINGIKTRVLELELLDVHDEVARAKERIAGQDHLHRNVNGWHDRAPVRINKVQP